MSQFSTAIHNVTKANTSLGSIHNQTNIEFFKSKLAVYLAAIDADRNWKIVTNKNKINEINKILLIEFKSINNFVHKYIKKIGHIKWLAKEYISQFKSILFLLLFSSWWNISLLSINQVKYAPIAGWTHISSANKDKNNIRNIIVGTRISTLWNFIVNHFNQKICLMNKKTFLIHLWFL